VIVTILMIVMIRIYSVN